MGQINYFNPQNAQVGADLSNLVTALFSGDSASKRAEREAHIAERQQNTALKKAQIDEFDRKKAAAAAESMAKATQMSDFANLVAGGAPQAAANADYVKSGGVMQPQPETADLPGIIGGYQMDKPPGFDNYQQTMIGTLGERLLGGKSFDSAMKGSGHRQDNNIIAQALAGTLTPQQQSDVAGARSKLVYHEGGAGDTMNLFTGAQNQSAPLPVARVAEIGAKAGAERALGGERGARTAQIRSETLPQVQVPAPAGVTTPTGTVQARGVDVSKAATVKPQNATGITEEGLGPMSWDAFLFGKNPPGMGTLSAQQRAQVANKRAQIGAGLGLSDAEIAMIPNDNKVKNKAYGNLVNWGAQVDRSAGVLNDTVDAALETAARLPLSTIQVVTKGVLAGIAQFNDPDANVYASQLNTIRREYGRLVSGPTSNAMLPVEAMKKGDELLSTGVDVASLQAVGNWFKREAAITQHRTNSGIESLRTSMVPTQKGAATISPKPGGAGVPKISSDEEYAALPAGARYIDPNNVTRTKR